MAGNLTRINNNQITDAVSGNTQFGINANTKVQPYSVTSTLLANNITYGSDLTITGNLSVTGNVTAIDTTNTTIEDPLLLLASMQTGAPAVDIGYIGQRGTSNNIAFVWQESSSEFVTVFTDSGATDNTTVNVLSYADFKTANANVTGTLVAANISFTGNVAGNLSVTGTLFAGNIETPGYVSALGNIQTANFFIGDGAYISNINAANVSATKISNGNSQANIGTPAGNLVITINGNSTATFYDTGLDVSGTVSTVGNVYASAVGTTADVSAAGNVYGANFETTGSGGNITGANVISATTLTATGNVGAGSYLFGDGYYISNINPGNVSSTKISNGGSYANIASTDGNLVIAVGAGSNIVATFYDTGISTVGNVDVGSNINLGGHSINDASNIGIQLYSTDYSQLNYNDSAYVYVQNTGVILETAGGTAQLDNNGDFLGPNNISATANVIGGNVLTSGLVSAGGNVIAFDSLNGANLSLSGNVISNLNVTNNVFANNVNTTNNVSATGNIFAANFTTTGTSGNITGANIIAAVTLTATGNIYGNNISATTEVSAGGNVITNQTFVGNALSGNTLIITSTAGGLQFSVTGNINAGNTYINNLPNPEQAQDAATKAYVDGIANGLQVKASSNTASTGNIVTMTGSTYVYDNGTLGVGATITLDNTGVITIDTVTLTAGMRVLIKDEPLVASIPAGTTPSAAYNGIYTVTTAGAVGTALVLTRSTDDDIPADMYSAYTFITSPGGATNSASGWASTNTPTSPGDPIIVGTTFYNWVQFSQAGSYSAGNAIAIVGTTISAKYDGNTIGVNGSNQLYIPANAPLVTPNIGDATGSSLSVTGSVTGNVLTVTTASVIGNVLAGNVSATGNVNGGNVLSSGELSATGNVYGGNVLTGDISASGNIINDVFTANSIAAGGNVDLNGGSGRYVNLAAATGFLVTGSAYVQGTSFGIYGGNSLISTSGNVIGANVLTGGDVSATGNITAANFNTSGSGGNISGANVISTVTLTATGNVYGANIITPNTTINGGVVTTGIVSALGNIQTGNYFIGDGGYISNINAANVSSTKISNGGSYANIATPSGNLVIAIGAGSSSVATFYDTGVDFGGNISVNGNVTGANFVGNLSGGLGSNLTVNNYVIQGGNYNGITLAMPIGFGANLSSAYEGGVTLAAGTGGTTAGTLLLDSTGNVSASGNVYATGNLTGANILTAGEVSATGTATVGNVLTAGFVSATANVIGGNILTAGYVSSTGNIQSGTTMLVDVTTSSVTLGANITQTTGATLAINATDSMLIPVGSTGDRPGTPATGMLRYNSTISQCEIWNGAAWVAVGGSSYTVITNEQFNGDGSTVDFTLGSSQTTDSCIVTINGVVQIPTTAYSVSGVYPTCVLTFTEAPQVSDTIDVREITTTTSVTAISNSPGNAIVAVSETIAQVNITGNLVAQLNASAPSLAANSSMSFQLVNNTTLAIIVRGTDGVTRSGNITLS
jgi:hypothetical protein